MYAYAFVRETDADGLDGLRRLVGAQDGVVAVAPLVGAHSAYVKVQSDEPSVVVDALTAVGGVEGVFGVETHLAWSPADRGTLPFPEAAARLPMRGVAKSESPASDDIDVWGLVRPLPPPPPMPTDSPVSRLLCFLHLSCEPGTTSAVYAQVASTPGVVGAAVVSAASPTVLVEISAEDEHALGFAVELASSVEGVTDAAASVGFRDLTAGLRSE